MKNTPRDTDPATWHRYFAIECNNRAWDLACAISRRPAEDEEMLNLAHAAALHWGVAGEELHHMRARTLLAEVHALLGMPSALPLAETLKTCFLGREDTPDWEAALVYAIHAHAASAAGDADAHRNSREEATTALGAIADPEERAIVQVTCDLVPAPG